jgi:hypothetical protein
MASLKDILSVINTAALSASVNDSPELSVETDNLIRDGATAESPAWSGGVSLVAFLFSPSTLRPGLSHLILRKVLTGALLR